MDIRVELSIIKRPEVLYTGHGRATIFGLEYNGKLDPYDNQEGFFGYNTGDKELHGVSLPVATLDYAIKLFNGSVAEVGSRTVERNAHHYINHQIMKDVMDKRYLVNVQNAAGVICHGCPIVDIGPASWTKNVIDLTYATAHHLETHGDAQVTFEIIDAI